MALDPLRAVLPNGVTVVAKANRTTPAVSLIVSVAAGAYFDPPGADGTAALLARVLDRGTSSRTAAAIADDLDGRGASLSIAAGRFQVTLSALCLARDAGHLVDVVADIAARASFPDAEVATRRTDLITAIRQDEDQPAVRAVDAFMLALYGSHPYARRVRGTAPSVARLTRADLEAFHRARFVPAATTVVVVGDIDEQWAVDAVGAAFGSAWADRPDSSLAGSEAVRAPAVPDAVRPRARQVVTVPMPDKAQADVAYGFVGIRRRDPDYTAAAVMVNALSQYAIGGRLGDSIRERQGMAYYVFGSLDAGFGEGPFTLRAGVAAANVAPTIDSIDRELSAVLAEGFTAREIDESKRYLVGSLPRQLETNGAIASFLLTSELFGLGVDYDVRMRLLVEAVTVDAANAAARRLLDPARATIAVAGPLPLEWHEGRPAPAAPAGAPSP